MFLHSLELVNIRSYENLSIDFPQGITVLSGDIGSGKTTVLLAIEFALFGILRGKTSPQELLRYGTKKGSVSLTTTIGEKTVVIKRTLKVTGSNILQSNGSLLIDGVEKAYVPTELKARVLTLLGYPESLLSKSSNLFRYTVYTPQEQVKAILLETVEERKDIIRKIFDIDKYKTVMENVGFFVNNQRTVIDTLRGKTDDIAELKTQHETRKKELTLVEEKILPLKKKLDECKMKRVDVEKQHEQYLIIVKEIDQKKNTKQLLQQQIKQQVATLQSIRRSIEEKIIEPKKVEFDRERYDLVINTINSINEKRKKISQELGKLDALRESAQKLASVQHIKNCPTCKQLVGEEHKKAIQIEQQTILKEVQQKKFLLVETSNALDEKEKVLNKKREELLEQKQKFAVYVEAKKNYEQKVAQQTKFKDQVNSIRKNIDELKEKETKLVIPPLPEKKPEIDVVRQFERQAELDLQSFTTRFDVLKQNLQNDQKIIDKKKQLALKLHEQVKTREWLQTIFFPLVRLIERRVLLKIYQEFNYFFTQWFGKLVEDENLQVRLDEDFTPQVTQNGYDTSISNLSGGEKTSLALAYRLALHKVLNDYFSKVHTKDLLILDEPTDGFSAQQIDKLRDVLGEVGIKQLIIVSHEQKMESLANNIIHISKNGASSSTLS